MLASAVDTMKSLPPQQQVVLALHYFAEIELAEIASRLGLNLDEVTAAHEEAVVAVHGAMTQAVTASSSGHSASCIQP
jgi:DNA-directed RNA polymerase specialized sigma24 family protein